MTLRGHRLGSTATALGAVAVAALSLTPVIYLFASGISLSDIRSEFHYPSTVSALLQTVGLTASVSVLTVAIGVGSSSSSARMTAGGASSRAKMKSDIAAPSIRTARPRVGRWRINGPEYRPLARPPAMAGSGYSWRRISR